MKWLLMLPPVWWLTGCAARLRAKQIDVLLSAAEATFRRG